MLVSTQYNQIIEKIVSNLPKANIHRQEKGRLLEMYPKVLITNQNTTPQCQAVSVS